MSNQTYAVQLNDVVKRYGEAVVAVQRTNLAIEEGSFVTLLGPSGCGKTTTLRMIAGLESPTEGDILIKGRRVNQVPIHRRNLGLVFQNYALFPHKSVFDNVAFGLKYRKVSRDEIKTRVREALELVQLPQMAGRYPGQLSGGQQQRIALARAIVIRPDVLLLDEPLSALDANLREGMRVELKNIQDRLGVTTVFVTHDQSEALAMSDRVVVMSHGHIEQVGTPEEVYNRPASQFVAEFLGNSNRFTGRVTAQRDGLARVRLEGGQEFMADSSDRPRQEGEAVCLVIRAEKIQVTQGLEAVGEEGTTFLEGQVDTVDYQGMVARYFLSAGGLSLQAINLIDRQPFPEGTRVRLRVRSQDCILLDQS
ncbi:MAG: ABC transporter ATP-binding protein [Candidatus Competibacteraceae bacterium]|nr:ABC transporter ATP-binding protein [Candidatus Competibacteraceae bacterium]